MEVINDTIYVFLGSGEILKVDCNGEISKISFPYEFQDTLNLKNPTDDSYVDKENFFGSEVKIGDNGEIYVLNLYKDDMFKIFQLKNNGNYQMIWQGEFPQDISTNLFVNSFEILNRN